MRISSFFHQQKTILMIFSHPLQDQDMDHNKNPHSLRQMILQLITNNLLLKLLRHQIYLHDCPYHANPIHLVVSREWRKDTMNHATDRDQADPPQDESGQSTVQGIAPVRGCAGSIFVGSLWSWGCRPWSYCSPGSGRRSQPPNRFLPSTRRRVGGGGGSSQRDL